MQFQYNRIAQCYLRFLNKWKPLHVNIKTVLLGGIVTLIATLITTFAPIICDDSHESYRCSIRIIDYNTNSPISGAEIFIMPGHHKGTTDQDGSFTFQLNSRGIQELMIDVNKNGYKPQKFERTLDLTNPIVLPISTKIDTL